MNHHFYPRVFAVPNHAFCTEKRQCWDWNAKRFPVILFPFSFFTNPIIPSYSFSFVCPRDFFQFIVFTSSKIPSIFLWAQRFFSFNLLRFAPNKNPRYFLWVPGAIFVASYRATPHRSLEVNAPRLRGEVWKLSWRTSDFFVARVGKQERRLRLVVCI